MQQERHRNSDAAVYEEPEHAEACHERDRRDGDIDDADLQNLRSLERIIEAGRRERSTDGVHGWGHALSARLQLSCVGFRDRRRASEAACFRRSIGRTAKAGIASGGLMRIVRSSNREISEHASVNLRSMSSGK